MAIYHLSVKPISRSDGRSATAAAAYRSAGRIEDATTGQVFDYTRKRGVEHAEIVLPTEAAQRDINWPRDRTALWNAAEQAERRRDARVAREYEVALPCELSTPAQRLALTREFSLRLANRHGGAVDFAIHRPHREGDQRNWHAHILTTTRRVEPTGLGAKTDIELKDRDRSARGLTPARVELTAIRAEWAQLANAHLQALGHSERVDHRSLEAQGLEREPTSHKGPALTALERRGVEPEVNARQRWEEADRANDRLAQAAEAGRLEREADYLQRSILALDGDIQAARNQRDRVTTAAAAEPPIHRPQGEERLVILEPSRDRADPPEATEEHDLAY